MAEKEICIPQLTTLGYIEKEDSYLMMHRVSKKNDLNQGKWIGIGGKVEKGERTEFSGEIRDCSEGVLEWIAIEEIPSLPLWKGDLLFLEKMRTEPGCFEMRLDYEGDDLIYASFNGKRII